MPTDHALPPSTPALTLPTGAGAQVQQRACEPLQAREPQRRRWAFMPLFVAGSFAAHGVAYAALAHVGSADGPRRLPPLEITMEVAEPAQPVPSAPEPVLAPVPVAPLAVARVAPKIVKPRAEPAPADAPPQAEPDQDTPPAPPLQTLGVSDAAGLAVAGQVGSGGALVGSLAGVRGGVEGGTGTAPAAASAPPVIDLRKLTSAWASQVSLAIGTRAVHAYPRAALRARVEGTVLLSVRVGTGGQIEDVALARSSGSPQLDEAALAAARELGAVPAPPAALHRYLRPFPVPVRYVISG